MATVKAGEPRTSLSPLSNLGVTERHNPACDRSITHGQPTHACSQLSTPR
jgi:hypothetical protein